MQTNNNSGTGSSVKVSISETTSPIEQGPSGSGSSTKIPDDTIAIEAVGSLEQRATTQFVDDSVMVMRDESHIAHIDKTILKLNDSQTSQENLLNFLSKPIILTRGNFAITDTFSVFNSFSMPNALLNGVNSPIWTQKLTGFFGIRMDMRFRIVVNANKFQQGRYIMGWTPLGGATNTISNLKNLNFNQAHNATLVQRTTVPHVELDLSTNTVAELLVPFASVHAFYPLNTLISDTDVASLGYLNIYPYDSLKAPTGSSTCGYTVYVSFENVSLYGASSIQGGHSPGDKEVSNKSNGPISGVASAVSKGFKEFGKIPLIGDYAKGISWIADRISSTASVFGFSKPVAGDSLSKMMLLNAPTHSTVDGDSDARTLSYLSKPGVVPLEGLSGTSYDEMDFSYIKARYAWFLTANWSLTQIPTIVVASILVSPATGQLSASGAFSFTPVRFISRQFRYWRGSLKFRFKIVKTEYHSGRLEFAFFPTDETTATFDSAYVNRLIVDIRDHSEIELIIPYISRTLWTDCESATGLLQVTVVDALVAPSSVSASINILCEIAGGEDFEVAVPDNFECTPYVFTPQGYSQDENVSTIISTTIGSSSINADPHLMSSITIGDKVSSVRAYLKRFVALQAPNNTAAAMFNNKVVTIVPDVILSYQGTYAATDSVLMADHLSIWASCYTFMSGGIRIRDILDYGLTNLGIPVSRSSVMAVLDIDRSSTSATAMVTPSASKGGFSIAFHRVPQDIGSNNTITVEVPQYTKSYSRNLVDCTLYQTGGAYNTANSYNGSGSVSPSRLNIVAQSGITITSQNGYGFHNLYRSGADDLNLSGFISIPPMLFLTTTRNEGFV